MSEIRCKEWVSTGGKYVEKGYTTQEVKTIFSEGDLTYQMAIEIERLQARVEQLEGALETYADPQYWNKDGTHAKGLGPGIAKRALAATEQEDACRHEWCDIATGGQYCRLCDARRPEYEGMAYDD